MSLKGPVHTRHFCTQYCGKKDKKTLIFLRHRIQCLTKVSSYQNLIQGIQGYDKSLPWLVIEIHCSKLSFYHNIVLSFYQNIVQENV